MSTWLDDAISVTTPEDRRKRAVDEENARHRKFLADTDWYVIRAQEQSVPIPEKIQEQRQAAREAIQHE